MKLNEFNVRAILIVFCLIFVFLASGCNSTSSYNDFNIESTKVYYQIEDFDSIVIDKSTIHDLLGIAFAEPLWMTSYGGYCDFPTEDGGYIRIKFYGGDMVVGAIEEISSHTEKD